MRLLRHKSAPKCALVAFLIALTLYSHTSLIAVNADPAHDDTSWLLGQINALRAQVGVAPLTFNTQLTNSATGHSRYLATNPWTDPHIESNGSTPHSRIAAAGYTGPISGENVYGGGLATAQIAFAWWVHEPLHYQNMVSPMYNDIGIGIATGVYGQFFTTDFGGRGDGSPYQPPAAPAAATPMAVAHRPAPPRPTNTPTLTLTPSITFTPNPTATPTITNTPVPPTPTAIELLSSPQPGLVVAALPSNSSVPQPTVLLSDSSGTSEPVQSALAGFAAPPVAPGMNSNPIRTLIPFLIGLQVIVVGGLLLRRGRGH